MATVAGTVYANCIGGPPVLAGVPVGGWAVDDSDDAGEVEFRNGTQKLEVHVVCTGGSPQFSVEGPRADDSRGGSSSAGTSSSSPASSSSSDDSGRDDSGHDSSGRGSDDSGSDDSSGDDSSGSGGGGHGSDD
jgi:hypothetical protein